MTEEQKNLPEEVRPPTPEDQGADPSMSSFPIIGIGASAGGLQAFEAFFDNMPSETGIAFVIVQHLDPTRESILTDLLQRHTAMRVVQVDDGMQIQPDNVYVVPPNRDMAVFHGTLLLTEIESHGGLRLPVDFLFRSLAEDQGQHAIGIILSGTGSDRTLGLKVCWSICTSVRESAPLWPVQAGLPAPQPSAIISPMMAKTGDAHAVGQTCSDYGDAQTALYRLGQ
jgi:two-component system CheB/CheR fusion protein